MVKGFLEHAVENAEARGRSLAEQRSVRDDVGSEIDGVGTSPSFCRKCPAMIGQDDVASRNAHVCDVARAVISIGHG